jgi:phosphoribosylamine---glycine ligase
MNVLVVGSGAREHTIAWKLRQSPRLTDLFVAPGNAGTTAIARNLPITAADTSAIVQTAADNRVDLVIVGPEDPLSRGLVDRLEANGIAAFGPSAAAARIESSKAFSSEIMARHGIPTARAHTFTRRADARAHIESTDGPLVVKADGLAAGKGVIVCDTPEEALQAVDLMMGDAAIFGEAGRTVVIQERLYGREVSAHAFTDGETVAPMPMSCDYKRARDADEGPNTGGMGAYSPPFWLDEAVEPVIHQQITEAVVNALRVDGTPFRGVIYPGVMVTPEGPRVYEYNCRFGDPEAQVVLPRLKSDLLEICWAVANRRLSEAEVQWSTEPCVGVVLASGGYPDDYATGFPIAGLGTMEDDVLVFHAGTRLGDDGETVLTSGGRVLTVVARGSSLAEARAKAYRNVQHIHFTNVQYRRDIAAPAQDARTE